MAQAFKCDLCGAYFDRHMPVGFYLNNELVRVSLSRSFGCTNNKAHVDLCNDCVDSLNEWFISRSKK